MTSNPSAAKAHGTQHRKRVGEYGLVIAGGAVGTALREALSLIFPTHGSFPWTILVINLTGAFILGALLEGLALRGPDIGGQRKVRLACGTGVLGGYTTYSTFAVGVDQAFHGGHAWIAIAYALTTVVGGFILGWLGIAAAKAVRSA